MKKKKWPNITRLFLFGVSNDKNDKNELKLFLAQQKKQQQQQPTTSILCGYINDKMFFSTVSINHCFFSQTIFNFDSIFIVFVCVCVLPIIFFIFFHFHFDYHHHVVIGHTKNKHKITIFKMKHK